MFFKNKKNKKKNLIPRLLVLSFVIIACVQTISVLFIANSPEFASASFLDDYILQTPIGEETKTEFKDYTTRPIAEYVSVIYKYAIGVVGIIAAVVLMIGGVTWLTAGGNATRVGEAKAWIGASFTGMVLVLTSYMILYQINPNLVAFTPIKIQPIGQENLELGGEIQNPPVYSGCEGKNTKNLGKGVGCSSGKLDVDIENCEGTYDTCCCDSLSWKQWGYQAGIKKQIDDASQDLEDMLKCMRKKLPNTVGEISAISDSYVQKGSFNWQECVNPATYKKPPCKHSNGSCHYGNAKRTDTSGSYAVDFGDEWNSAAIISAAKACGASRAVLEDGNHVHVSTPGCSK